MNNLTEIPVTNKINSPKPGVDTILVTGATGYIGGRLVPELTKLGYKLRVLVRVSSPIYKERWPNVEIAFGDAQNYDKLKASLEGVHTAFYLIHSLNLGHKKFESVDLLVAENFRKAAEEQNVKRIIYLCGLGDENSKLSPHLRNRIKVAEYLSAGKIPVTTLRAGMIIGSGSASYEILKDLIYNSPLFFVPKWAKTKSQPVAIRNVLKFLVGVMEKPETAGRVFDIGGKDILTYDEMLRTFASILGKKKIFLPGLITYTPLYGLIAGWLTSVPGPLTKVLVEGCKNEVICQNDDLKNFLNFEPLTFREAIESALENEERDTISTRWTDAYPPQHDTAIKLHELNYSPTYTRSYLILTHKDPAAVFNSFCKVGGKNGWFHNNWMWRLRGALDKLLMGVGTSRGRRSSSTLRVNDVVDFWRVENIQQNRFLLLRAEMKLPGLAWLEFNIDNGVGVNKLSVNAYFEPKGIKGVLYWYNFLPFHNVIFTNLLKQIERRS